MRIMWLVARLNTGGVALNVVQTLYAMHQAGHEVLLVFGQVGPHEGNMSYLLERYPVPHLLIPSLGRELSPYRDLLTLWLVWRAMRRFRPTVVHTHTAKAGFIGRWAAWLAGVKIRVHTFHGHVFHGYFSPRKTAFFLGLERLTAHLTSRLITLSESLAQDLAETYRLAPRKSFSVIPLGLSLAPLLRLRGTPSPFRQDYALPAEALLVAVVGRLVPIKNHALFLRAAARLRQRLPQAHFLIIGDGELRPALQAQAEALGLASAVTFVGWLEDLRPVYAALDLVTITSDNEGTPVSLLEALVAGIPIVSTAVGGVADIIGARLAPYLVAVGDEIALAEAWYAALTSPPDLQNLPEQLLADYDLAQAVQRHLALYRNLGA
jgi:glycosyltransferase involved in cell wall biosynthesis